MPTHCDGCGEAMTVEHALKCKVGGLVHIRHEDGGGEFRHLCGLATSPGRIKREPYIYSCAVRQTEEEAIAAAEANPPPPAVLAPSPCAAHQAPSQQRQLQCQQQRQQQQAE